MTLHSGRTGAWLKRTELTAADAQRVEEAFQARLAAFVAPAADEAQTPARRRNSRVPQLPAAESHGKDRGSKVIDKSVLAILGAAPDS